MIYIAPWIGFPNHDMVIWHPSMKSHLYQDNYIWNVEGNRYTRIKITNKQNGKSYWFCSKLNYNLVLRTREDGKPMLGDGENSLTIALTNIVTKCVIYYPFWPQPFLNFYCGSFPPSVSMWTAFVPYPPYKFFWFSVQYNITIIKHTSTLKYIETHWKIFFFKYMQNHVWTLHKYLYSNQLDQIKREVQM